MAETPNLRWHAWVRTRNGGISGYLRVKAPSATSAVLRAVNKAPKELSNGKWGLSQDEWVCTGVSMHEEDTKDLVHVPSF